MSEIKTEFFKVFLQKQSEYYYKLGGLECLKTICGSIDEMESNVLKAKLELIDAAKECGIEPNLEQ